MTVIVAQSVFDSNNASGPEAAVNAFWVPRAFGRPIAGLPVIKTALSGGGGGLALLKTTQGYSTVKHGGQEVTAPQWHRGARCHISDTWIARNTADSAGGGLAIKNVDVALSNVTVELNRARTAGGGLFVASGTAALSVTGGAVRANVATTGGGQIDVRSNAAVRFGAVVVRPSQPGAATGATETLVRLGGVAPLVLAAGTEIRCAAGQRLAYSGNLLAPNVVEVMPTPDGGLLAVLGVTASLGCRPCPGNLVLPSGAGGVLQVVESAQGRPAGAITTNWTECEAPQQCKPGSVSPTGGLCEELPKHTRAPAV